MSRFDEIWGRVTRALSFIGGLGIMLYETALSSSDRPWLYAAALGMMGLPVAHAANELLAKFSSSNAPQQEAGGASEKNGKPAE